MQNARSEVLSLMEIWLGQSVPPSSSPSFAPSPSNNNNNDNDNNEGGWGPFWIFVVTVIFIIVFILIVIGIMQYAYYLKKKAGKFSAGSEEHSELIVDH